jgi:hypothetical protein
MQGHPQGRSTSVTGLYFFTADVVTIFAVVTAFFLLNSCAF